MKKYIDRVAFPVVQELVHEFHGESVGDITIHRNEDKSYSVAISTDVSNELVHGMMEFCGENDTSDPDPDFDTSYPEFDHVTISKSSIIKPMDDGSIIIDEDIHIYSE